MHTPLCGHAEGAPEEYVACARSLGIPEVCFTDHAPAPDGYDPITRMTIDKFVEYKRMISDAAKAQDITVLYGIEADYYPGCEKFQTQWLKSEPFDLVIGSVHFIGNWGFDNPANMAVWKSTDTVEAWRSYFELAARMASTGLYDIVAHLDLPKKFGHLLPVNDCRREINDALDAMATTGMTIEINTSGLRRKIADTYPSRDLLEMARRHGIPVCFGSDAHKPADVGFAFDKALALAREAGYTETVTYRQRRSTTVPLP